MDRTDKINKLPHCFEIKPKLSKDLCIERNTINLNLSLDLYHILSYENLCLALKSQQLYMRNPSMWNDPYETFSLNCKIIDPSGNVCNFDEIKKNIYYQCWSKNGDSEALWKVDCLGKVDCPGKVDCLGKIDCPGKVDCLGKVYCPGKVRCPDNVKRVRIKSRGDKLIKSLYNIDHQFHDKSYFIGSVDYVSEDLIETLLKGAMGQYLCSPQDVYLFIRTLFIKRKAFEYESEVRLVYYRCVHARYNKELFPFKIDINEVIEEITFHPKLTEAECRKMETQIKALGYKGRVNQSELYKAKDIVIYE